MTDKHQAREVTEIIHLWIKTFGLMKIFAPDHTNVRKFTSQLYQKLKSFIERHSFLEIGVKEFSFLFEGQPVYTDDQSGSLPFFFYKDGMASLFFHKELSLKEFKEFLEITDRESNLPPEESDIVSAFWERDFVNVRYFAPDEYLESQIGLEVDVKEYEIDREALYSGRVELLPEDKEALRQGQGLLQSILPTDYESDGAETDPSSAEEDISETFSFLSERENQVLVHRLQSNRTASPDQELTSLLLELLYLEEEPVKLAQTLEALQECLGTLLDKEDYSQADVIVTALDELIQDPEPDDQDIQALLTRFRQDLTERSRQIDVTSAAAQGNVSCLESLLSYLEHVGPDMLPLVGRISVEVSSPPLQVKTREVLRILGDSSPGDLLDIVQKNHPELALEILEILPNQNSPGVAAKIANLLNWSQPRIRKAAIQALGRLSGPISAKFLAVCLQDGDEDIRTSAIENLVGNPDESARVRVMTLAGDKSFHQKSAAERESVLRYLAESAHSESDKALVTFVRKVGRWKRTRKVETADLAISALVDSANPRRLDLLEQAGRTSHPMLRTRCQILGTELRQGNGAPAFTERMK
jgi:hypothetical protein